MAEAKIGELIRRKRRDNRMNQVDAAAILGINQSTVAKWERGDRIAADRLPSLARFLGMPLAELLPLYHAGAVDDGFTEAIEEIHLILTAVEDLPRDLAALRADVAGLRTDISRLERALRLEPRHSDAPVLRRRRAAAEPTR